MRWQIAGIANGFGNIRRHIFVGGGPYLLNYSRLSVLHVLDQILPGWNSCDAAQLTRMDFALRRLAEVSWKQHFPLGIAGLENSPIVAVVEYKLPAAGKDDSCKKL